MSIKMKTTKRKLRKVIREAIDVINLSEGWNEIHGRAADYAPNKNSAMVGLDKVRQAAQSRRAMAASDKSMLFMNDDADDLEEIADMFESEIMAGASPGSFSEDLRHTISRLDTAVREEIHTSVYYSIFPEII